MVRIEGVERFLQQPQARHFPFMVTCRKWAYAIKSPTCPDHFAASSQSGGANLLVGPASRRSEQAGRLFHLSNRTPAGKPGFLCENWRKFDRF